MKITIAVILVSFLLNLPVYNRYISRRADINFEKEYYPRSLRLYTKLAHADTTNLHVITRLADSYRMINDFENAELWYAKALRFGDVPASVIFNYAEMLKYNSKPKEALVYMQKYYEHNRMDVRAQRHISSDDFARLIEMELMTVDIHFLEMNSENSEFGVAFRDKNTVVFSSTRHGAGFFDRKNLRDDNPFFNLYQAEISNRELINIRAFAQELSSDVHEGPVVFSIDGNEIFFTRNIYLKRSRYEERINRLMIYRSVLEDGQWSEPELLPFNSEDFSCGHPALSPDGRTLYFVSDMSGGFGETDIYRVHRQGESWSRPENLGEIINTPGKEMFPYMHSDGRLYFSSDGYATIGGLDIFAAEPHMNGFKEPINLGIPINSPADDFAFVLDSDGFSGFLSSNRRKNVWDDLYHFIILPEPPKALPDHVLSKRYNEKEIIMPLENDIMGDGKLLLITEFTENTASGGSVERSADKQTLTYFLPENFWGNDTIFYTICDTLSFHTQCSRSFIAIEISDAYYGLEGLVVMKDTEEPVADVTITLNDEYFNPIATIKTDHNGTFRLDLLKDKSFFIRLEKEGYMLRTVSLSTMNVPPGIQNIKEVIEIEKLEGLSFELMILFDLGKWAIRPDAAIELDEKAVTFLTENPSVTIELSAHTDSRGSARSNQILSQRRAESAVQYLISRGIAPERMVAKGYGEERLLNHCEEGVRCSEEEHQRNRRVEITVTSY